MIACTWPLGTSRLIPLRISLSSSASLTRRFFISNMLTPSPHRGALEGPVGQLFSGPVPSSISVGYSTPIQSHSPFAALPSLTNSTRNASPGPKVSTTVPTSPALSTGPGVVCDSALRRLPSRSSNSRFTLAVVTAANKSAASRIFSLHLSLAVRSTTLLGQVVSRPFHLTSVLPNFTIAAPLSIRLCTRVPRRRLARNLLLRASKRQFSKRRTDFRPFAAAQREPAWRAVRRDCAPTPWPCGLRPWPSRFGGPASWVIRPIPQERRRSAFVSRP